MRGQVSEDENRTSAIEIPAEVDELAKEAGLTYRQTLALLEIDRSVMAHRRNVRPIRDREYWDKLYDAVKPFLEDNR